MDTKIQYSFNYCILEQKKRIIDPCYATTCNNIYIFAALKWFIASSKMGLTGFDSGQKWWVSMQCVGNLHLNISYQNFIWRK
ncbi:MAG: hypothetical protein H6Q13_512 [Bacteroidetes bacterium]|nr:hypothetical protein [Bacteroidota bacterium]